MAATHTPTRRTRKTATRRRAWRLPRLGGWWIAVILTVIAVARTWPLYTGAVTALIAIAAVIAVVRPRRLARPHGWATTLIHIINTHRTRMPAPGHRTLATFLAMNPTSSNTPSPTSPNTPQAYTKPPTPDARQTAASTSTSPSTTATASSSSANTTPPARTSAATPSAKSPDPSSPPAATRASSSPPPASPRKPTPPTTTSPPTGTASPSSTGTTSPPGPTAAPHPGTNPHAGKGKPPQTNRRIYGSINTTAREQGSPPAPTPRPTAPPPDIPPSGQVGPTPSPRRNPRP
jgi:hypothetical protein